MDLEIAFHNAALKYIGKKSKEVLQSLLEGISADFGQIEEQ